MIEITFGPKWFYLTSILIDVVSFIVLFLIASLAVKYYKLNSNKNYAKLGFAFYLIAVSFLLKMMTNLTVYYDSIASQAVTGTLIQTIEVVRSFNIVAISSFTLFVLANLAGLYALYSIKRGQQQPTVFLTVYFILVLTFISAFYGSSLYYIFHLTSLLFLVFIASRYFNIHSVTKHSNTKWLGYGFSVLAISQGFFMFIVLGPVIYVTAEIVQLIGFAMLLYVFVKVLQYGKKKE